MSKIDTSEGWTAEGLRKMIGQMDALSSQFYRGATSIGNHAFIEFNGLMNEYIKLCAKMLEQGGNFALASTHTGLALPMASYHAAYVGEKLECIYGAAFEQDHNLARAMISRLLGETYREFIADEFKRLNGKPGR